MISVINVIENLEIKNVYVIGVIFVINVIGFQEKKMVHVISVIS